MFHKLAGVPKAFKNLTGTSFNDIFQLNHKRVYNLALNYVQHTEDAEEITQDVFIKVHKELQNFKGESSVETWIYRIAINQSLDFLRYKNRAKRKGFLIPLFTKRDEEETALDIPDFNHPGIAAEKQENAKSLYAAINKLNENQQTAFILFFVEDMPQKEVAAIMELSLKAVESLLQRAKAQLRKLLENEFDKRRINK